jgi:chromosome segregation protein
VQTQGKVQPWLKKHELASCRACGRKLHIDQGWETALESVLRERTSALEVSNLDWAKAFFNDAPPAKLALFSPNAVAAPGPDAPAGLKPLLSLLQLNDPGLRTLMQDWLHNVFVAEDVTAAFVDRNKLPAGGCFVTRQGHLISKSSVRFYASDSEQDGMLARQQEIENITKQLRAQQCWPTKRSHVRCVRGAALTQATQKLAGIAPARRYLDANRAWLADRGGEAVRSAGALQPAQHADRGRSRGNRAQEAEQQQVKAESEAKFEQLDVSNWLNCRKRTKMDRPTSSAKSNS